MPRLQDNRKIETVQLKSIPGGEVQVYTSLLAKDMEAVAAAKNNGVTSNLFAFTLLIKGWNLTGEDDQVLPITLENIGLLEAGDLLDIQDKASLDDFLKRANSDIS